MFTKTIGVVLVCFTLFGCTQNQILTTLEASVDAAIAADATIRPQDAPALALVTGCLDNAETELASGSTSAITIAEISAACASAIAASQNNVDLVAVSAALNAFLKAINVQTSQVNLTASKSINASASSNKEIHFSLNKNKLSKIRSKIEKLKKNLKIKK